MPFGAPKERFLVGINLFSDVVRIGEPLILLTRNSPIIAAESENTSETKLYKTFRNDVTGLSALINHVFVLQSVEF
jgi:hypothetical protein